MRCDTALDIVRYQYRSIAEYSTKPCLVIVVRNITNAATI